MTKLKILLEQVLKERITDKVYHMTTTRRALSILESDTFRASSVFGKKSEKKLNPEGYNYFISTARIRNSSYIRSFSVKEGSVIFVLDGNKLNQNFKGRAVNFDMKSSHNATGRNTEVEDRVFLRKPFIKNFSKYIKRVDIFVEKPTNGNYLSRNSWIEARKIILQCKKYNIDYLIFKEKIDFIKGDKKLSIPFENVKGYMKGSLPRQKQASKTLDKKDKEYLTSFIFLYYSKSLYDFYSKNKTKGKSDIFPSNNFKPEELKKWVSDPKNKADFLSSIADILRISYYGIENLLRYSYYFDYKNDDKKHKRISDAIEKIFRTERVSSLNDKLKSKIINKWKDILDNYIE